MTLETLPGTLRGYRAWSVDFGAGPFRLRPAGFRSTDEYVSTWYSLSAKATCAASPKASIISAREEESPQLDNCEAPSRRCSCGLYARYNDIEEYDHLPILGSVKAHGRIIIQERGFRSEFMTVEAICPGPIRVIESLPYHAIKLFADIHNIPMFPSLAALQEALPPADVRRWPTDAHKYRLDLQLEKLKALYMSPPTLLQEFKLRHSNKGLIQIKDSDANTDGR